MEANLSEKTRRYERLLSEALEAVDRDTVDERGEEFVEMAQSYLNDGRHFLESGDEVNALASFSYGHGWLDAGVRAGFYDHDADGGEELFADE
ncbi:MAG: DUF357 domain-containing protein [Halobacteria archaeon]|nr:DUF357 domain-containing protein [Halobacteria archaeon]